MLYDPLNAVFGALADPTRRAILARLAAGEASVTELAAPFSMSLPAISKHLKMLERAGLISRGREAQWRPCRLAPEALKEATEWLDTYRRFWDESLDNLTEYLERVQSEKRPPSGEKAVSDERVLVITRMLDAPRELVFAAWTNARSAAEWWGPKGFTSVSCKIDARVGGAWRRVMRSPDGVEHRAGGVYCEIATPERLVFTYAWEDSDGLPGHQTLVTLMFRELGGKTELTLRQEVFETTAARDDHRSGWVSCLDRLTRYLTHQYLTQGR